MSIGFIVVMSVLCFLGGFTEPGMWVFMLLIDILFIWHRVSPVSFFWWNKQKQIELVTAETRYLLHEKPYWVVSKKTGRAVRIIGHPDLHYDKEMEKYKRFLYKQQKEDGVSVQRAKWKYKEKERFEQNFYEEYLKDPVYKSEEEIVNKRFGR